MKLFSSLDNEIKEIVSEIELLKGSKTIIIIAHRLSTVKHCDRIYRLQSGKIVEVGTPEEVLNYQANTLINRSKKL